MSGAGGSNFFLAKGSKAEAAKKRKAAKKGSLVKTKPKSGQVSRKAKTFDTGSGLTAKKKKRKEEDEDEEILSDASDVVGRQDKDKVPDAGYSSDEDVETAEEKRLRLAKVFLDEIRREEEERLGQGGDMDEDTDDKGTRDAINQRLKEHDLEQSGKLRLKIAHKYTSQNLVTKTQLYRDHKVHKACVTCHAVTRDGSTVMTGSKDGGLVWWSCHVTGDDVTLTRVARVGGGRKGHEEKYEGHCGAVNAVAVTSDAKFYASGDDRNLIHIWTLSKDNPKKGEDLSGRAKKVHTFRGHRGPVSGLAFRKNSHNLYSCAHDRSVKSWNLDEMAYVETLFGHQDRITGVDAGFRERAVTSGGRDGTVRVWKIVEESQLVFNAPSLASSKGSSSGSGSTASGFVDAVKLIDEESFATCGEDGHLSLWSVLKKKPVATVRRAHGTDPTNEDPRWVSALATIHNTDLVATGSSDGTVKLWSADHMVRKLTLVNELQLGECGFVNSIAIHPGGRHLLVGVGQEHRLGRWWSDKNAKNGLLVITLNTETTETTEKTEEDMETG